jgi:hypothetical protein
MNELKQTNCVTHFACDCITRKLIDYEKLESKLKVAVVTMQRRMKSDDACELPFDEDMAEALKEIES